MEKDNYYPHLKDLKGWKFFLDGLLKQFEQVKKNVENIQAKIPEAKKQNKRKPFSELMVMVDQALAGCLLELKPIVTPEDTTLAHVCTFIEQEIEIIRVRQELCKGILIASDPILQAAGRAIVEYLMDVLSRVPRLEMLAGEEDTSVIEYFYQESEDVYPQFRLEFDTRHGFLHLLVWLRDKEKVSYRHQITAALKWSDLSIRHPDEARIKQGKVIGLWLRHPPKGKISRLNSTAGILWPKELLSLPLFVYGDFNHLGEKRSTVRIFEALYKLHQELFEKSGPMVIEPSQLLKTRRINHCGR